MDKTRYQQWRLVPFILICSLCAGADDDVVEGLPQKQRQEVNAPSLFNRTLVRESLDNELRYKVDEFRANYDLTQAQQTKLSLAGRVDVRRVLEELEQVHRVADFREKKKKLFGSDSFLVKAIPRVLSNEQSSKYQKDVNESLRLFHRSNIEGVIRDIERHVVLRIAQQEALVDHLYCELPPPKIGSEFDHLVVKYQFSRMSERSLKSLFDEEQWPQVNKVIEGYRGLAAVLKREGLINEEFVGSDGVTKPGED